VHEVKRALAKEAMRREPGLVPAFDRLLRARRLRAIRRTAAVGGGGGLVVGAALVMFQMSQPAGQEERLLPAQGSQDRVTYHLSYEDAASYLSQGDEPVEDCVALPGGAIELAGESLPAIQRVSVNGTSQDISRFEDCLEAVPHLTATRVEDPASPNPSASR
jgi:hypothetical protein